MNYPEHEKLHNIKDQSQIIGDFLENLPNGLVLARWGGFEHDDLFLAHKRTEEVLADYFGIDLDKIEQEKRAMLEELRAK